jgi:hypothetical protein
VKTDLKQKTVVVTTIHSKDTSNSIKDVNLARISLSTSSKDYIYLSTIQNDGGAAFINPSCK